MTMNETLKNIKERRSVRSFKNEQIKDSELQTVLEAGFYAPSAMNQQCWNFTVVQNKNLLEEIGTHSKEIAKEFDNEHLQTLANNEKFNVFYGAPTVVVISGEENALLSEADCAAATQNMLIAAQSIGLGSCWINFGMFVFNGPKAEYYKQQLQIPAGYTPYYSVALGYKTAATMNAPKRKENIINYVK
ncbi:nitroreductase family protein [Pelosinus sp. sgz500959]|uniref:nitroreductase family protein n=1 Tax=Pelosinus sp. sgz500959 TaxID=3242472 RepID=UPI0036703CCC